jgi:hypothetical protein
MCCSKVIGGSIVRLKNSEKRKGGKEKQQRKRETSPFKSPFKH